MMMKTRIFVAKSMAKKSYKDAKDAIKTFKADRAGGKMFTKIKTKGKKIPNFVKSNLKALRKPTGMKAKTMAGIKKIKSGATLPAVGFGLGAAGGFGTAGAVTYLMGYNRGKKDKNKKKG